MGSAYRVELALYREALMMVGHMRRAHLTELAARWTAIAADSRRDTLAAYRATR
jgi:hypothetical protein